MPIYEYRCVKCGKVFETLVKSAGAAAAFSCPDCGSVETTRLFSRFGFKSGSTTRASLGGSSCSSCRPSPGQCGTCG